MSCIHYKFRSSLEYDTLTFDGLAISLADLKKSIMAQKKFAKVTDFDLEVTNAQTKEEYKDDTTQIPKNSSVIVRRIPTGTRSKAQLAADRADPFASGLPKTKNDLQELQSNVSMKQNKVVDLVSSDASEEDKLKAMMSQAGEDWQPNQYVRGRGRGYNPSGPLPPNYVCYRCGKPGHFIRNCPTNGVKRTIGIPRKFGEEADSGTVEDSNKETKKETSDSTKKMVPVPEIDVSKKDRKVPSELKCPMCRNLLTDAVLIPCCGTSYCDECIRTYLLENEQVCPTCGAEDVSPDSLIINKQLRQAVNNFRNARPASPFVNSTTVDKPTPSTSADKPTPNGSTIDKPVTSNTNALKVPSTTVPDSTPQSATPDVHSTDTSDKEKSEQKVSSTTSEPPQKEIPEVKEENVKKKESSPLVFKAEVSSPKKDQFNDDHHHHKAPAREHLRTGTRSAGVHTSQHPGSISSYGHHDHPVHRGPPHGHNIGHPINEPLMHRTVPPEGALFVPPIRPPRPLLTQAHPGPLMPRPGFISSAPIGLHPSIVHAPLRVEPNLLGGPLPFGVNPSGFHPFENPMHGTGGLPPMSEEEFYRYQRKMKRNKRLKQREKEKSSRRERSSNHGQPGNFDDELSQYKAIQRHRTRPRSRSRSYSRSRSRSHSNSRSFSRSLSHSSHSLSKSPTPEDWDRSRTPSPVDSPTKSGSKSPNNEEKKPKHKKRKKHHKHKHSKKQKSTENEDSETKVKEKIQKGENEKTEKKKSKSKKRSKDKEKTSKNKKKTKETSERTQVNSEESITELNESENSEKETPIEKVNENLEESLKTDEGKLKELNVETEQDYEESRLEIEVNEKEKSRKRKSDERKSEEDGAKRKSKEKSGDKKHKKKKHKRKHKRHKKEKEKTSSQSAEGNNESTEETQEDSEEENGKDQSVKD